MRHRADMRIVCECGRTINVPFGDILKLFSGLPLPIANARSRAKCKRCFARSRVIVSPVPTVGR